MRLKGGERCAYCGYFAEVRDHVIPWSFNAVSGRKRTYDDDDVVPACRECNHMAGDKVFKDLVEKRDYIQERIAKKYKKLLETPNWSDDELNELAPRMRKYVRLQLMAKRFTESRIRWPFNYYSLVSFSEEVFEDLFD